MFTNLLLVLILNATISQPWQFSYFYLDFGPLSASVSYKTFSYKKNECIQNIDKPYKAELIIGVFMLIYVLMIFIGFHGLL